MKSTLSILSLCFAVAAMSAPLTPAQAAGQEPGQVAGQEAGMKGSLAQACKGDISKYCGDVTPGKGRIMACLKAHDDKLSSGCSDQWNQAKAEFRKNVKQMHAACSGDVQKFCSQASGPKAIRNCLSDHESDLSASCKNFREQNKMTG